MSTMDFAQGRSRVTHRRADARSTTPTPTNQQLPSGRRFLELMPVGAALFMDSYRLAVVALHYDGYIRREDLLDIRGSNRGEDYYTEQELKVLLNIVKFVVQKNAAFDEAQGLTSFFSSGTKSLVSLWNAAVTAVGEGLKTAGSFLGTGIVKGVGDTILKPIKEFKDMLSIMGEVVTAAAPDSGAHLALALVFLLIGGVIQYLAIRNPEYSGILAILSAPIQGIAIGLGTATMVEFIFGLVHVAHNPHVLPSFQKLKTTQTAADILRPPASPSAQGTQAGLLVQEVLDNPQGGNEPSSFAKTVSDWLKTLGVSVAPNDLISSVRDFQVLVSTANSLKAFVNSIITGLSNLLTAALTGAHIYGSQYSLYRRLTAMDALVSRVYDCVEKQLKRAEGPYDTEEATRIVQLFDELTLKYLSEGTAITAKEEGVYRLALSSLAPFYSKARGTLQNGIGRMAPVGLILLGPSQVGKSSLWAPTIALRALARAFKRDFGKTNVYHSNPDPKFPYSGYQSHAAILFDDLFATKDPNSFQAAITRAMETTGAQCTPAASSESALKGTVFLNNLITIFTENNPDWSIILKIQTNPKAFAQRLRSVYTLVFVDAKGVIIEDGTAEMEVIRKELTGPKFDTIVKEQLRFQEMSWSTQDMSLRPSTKLRTLDEVVDIVANSLLAARDTYLNASNRLDNVTAGEFASSPAHGPDAPAPTGATEGREVKEDPPPKDTKDGRARSSSSSSYSSAPEISDAPTLTDYKSRYESRVKSIKEASLFPENFVPDATTADKNSPNDLIRHAFIWHASATEFSAWAFEKANIPIPQTTFVLNYLKAAYDELKRTVAPLLGLPLFAALGAFTLAGTLIAAFLVGSWREDDPQSFDQRTEKKAPRRTALVNPRFFAGADLGASQPQNSTPQGALGKKHDQISALFSSVMHVEIYSTDDNADVYRQHAFALNDVTIVTASHSLGVALHPENEATTRIRVIRESSVVEYHPHDLSITWSSEIPDDLMKEYYKTFHITLKAGHLPVDFCVLRLPRTRALAGVRDRTGLFVPFAGFEKLVGSSAARLTKKIGASSVQETSVGNVKRMATSRYTVPGTDINVEIPTVFEVDVLGSDGMCTAPYVSLDPSTDGLIFGLHIAARYGGMSLVGPFPREIAKFFVEDDRDSKRQVPLEHLVSFDVPQTLVNTAPPLACVKSPTLIMGMPRKHDFVTSYFAQDPTFPLTSDKQPSKLEFLNFGGKNIFHRLHSTLQTKVDQAYLSDEDKEFLDIYMAQLELPDVPVRTSIDVAINGDHRMNAIEPRSSAGLFGLRYGKRSKEAYLVGTPGHYTAVASVLEEVEDILDDTASGASRYTLVPALPKSEPLEPAKCVGPEARSRAFYSQSLPELLVNKMFSYGSSVTFKRNAQALGIIVGADPWDMSAAARRLVTEWRSLAFNSRGGSQLTGLDAKANDITTNARDIELYLAYRRRLHTALYVQQGVDVNKARILASEEVEFLASQFHPLVIIPGVFRHADGRHHLMYGVYSMYLVASGLFDTTDINSFLSISRAFFAWRLLHPEPIPTWRAFTADVFFYVYSDDCLVLLKNDTIEAFLEALNARPTGPRIEDEGSPTIIARHVRATRFGFVFALRLPSIAQTLSFVSRKGDPEQLHRQNAETALRELVPYGPERWLSVFEACNRVFRDRGWRPIVQSWQEALAEWESAHPK